MIFHIVFTQDFVQSVRECVFIKWTIRIYSLFLHELERKFQAKSYLLLYYYYYYVTCTYIFFWETNFVFAPYFLSFRICDDIDDDDNDNNNGNRTSEENGEYDDIQWNG